MKKSKKNWKKILSVVLTVALIIGLMPGNVIVVSATGLTNIETEESVQVGAFTVTGGTNGTDYSFEDGILTIKTDTALTIKNTDSSVATTNKIYIEDGVSANIVLAGVNINMSKENTGCAFEIAANSKGNVTITIASGTKNILKSGRMRAGLQKNSDTSGGTLTIQGDGNGIGWLTAIGTGYGAGIGGGNEKDSSNITISNVIVEASGGIGSTGIGGGYRGDGNNIVINNSVVTATGASSAAGIGAGELGSCENIQIIGSSVHAIAATDIASIGMKTADGGVFPTNGTERVYLLKIENPESKTVYIDNVEYAYKEHNGEKVVYAYVTGEKHSVRLGDEEEKEYIFCPVEDGLFITSETEMSSNLDFEIAGGTYGTDYIYMEDRNVLYVFTDTPLTIRNKADVEVADTVIETALNRDANIILNGVNIDVGETENRCAFKIANNSTGCVTITLTDGTKNILKSGAFCAGLQKNGDASTGTLIIQGEGSSMGHLEVSTGSYGAGIGGGDNGDGCNITISNAIVTATGGMNGAGIGGGNSGDGRNITIKDAIVTASGKMYGAGVGGGYNGEGSNVVIMDSSVKAVAEAGINAFGGGLGCDATVPTNGIQKMYLLPISNENGAEIYLDDEKYPYKDHNGETTIYAYVTGENHTVRVAEETTEYIFISAKEIFEKKAELELTEVPDFEITGGTHGADYLYLAKYSTLYVLTDTPLTIKNKNNDSAAKTVIEAGTGCDANIIFDGVNIDVSETENACAFKIPDYSKSSVTITLADGTVNTLKSGANCAGLQKNGNVSVGTLTIKGESNGTGMLVTTGGEYGAGIGGGAKGNSSNIVVSGGIVTANGGTDAAGIGGGSNGDGSNIVINGGSVKAVAGLNANAFGGGSNGNGAVIPINSLEAGAESVYLLMISNEDDKEITINNIKYPKAHGAETQIYVYLPAKASSEAHVVNRGEDEVKYCYDVTDSKWLEVVDIPKESSSFTYDGTEKTYVLEESKYYTISDNIKQTDAGIYTVTITLNDVENTVWCDGTTEVKKYDFLIEKAAPNVTTSPKVEERFYHPTDVLQNDDLVDGEVKGVDGSVITGVWSWERSDIVPTVNNTGYKAVFAPKDENYETVSLIIPVKVTAVTPYIAKVPVAGAITFGQSLRDSLIDGAVVQYSATNDTSVAGTLAWTDESIQPTVSDSNKTLYDVVYSVEDKENYNSVALKISLTVNKAAAPVLTGEYRNYTYSISKNAEKVKITGIPTNSGEVNYTFTETDDSDMIENVSIVDGIITYDVKELDHYIEGDSATITVAVEMENYETATYDLVIGRTDKLVQTIHAEDIVLTYGDNDVVAKVEGVKTSLTYTVIEDSNKDGDVITVDVDGNIKAINAGTAKVKITAVESDVYKEAFCEITVTVVKAKGVIIPKYDTYTRIYNDPAFSIAEDITTIGEGTVLYHVIEAVDAEGNKEASDIITISEDGVVTIVGSGSVKVALDMEETANYEAAQTKIITICISAWSDVDRDGFFVKEVGVESYTGKAVKPEPEIWDGNLERCLELGKDYTISYKNNKNAYTLKEGEEGFNAKKAPTMIIKGKGNYNDKLTVYFTILPQDISNATEAEIVTEDVQVEANGKVQKKIPVIKVNGKKLGRKDFVASYPALEEDSLAVVAYKEPGTYPIAITGTGNYTGSRMVNLIVTAKGTGLTKATIKKIPAQVYDGVNAVELDETELVVTAKVNGKKETLKKGVHYTVEYDNNKAVGTATVTVKAIEGSGFAGFKKANFKVNGVSIAKATVEGVENQIFSGSAQQLALKVTLSVKDAETGVVKNVVLVEGTDYKVAYSKNTNVGTASVTITGMGKYTGTIKKNFQITAADITGLVTAKDGEFTTKYVKGGAKPDLSLVFNGRILKEGKDYTVTYKNNKAVYTAKAGEQGFDAKKAPTVMIKGKGNFVGSVSYTYTITARSLTDADMAVTMSVADKAVSTKRGGYISKVVLTDVDGKVLKQGVDYSAPVYSMINENGETVTLTKEDIVSLGSVITVSVNGMGAYEDTEGRRLAVTYCITAKDFSKVKVSNIQKKYTGKAVELTAADFLKEDGSSKVTIGGESLVYGKDFEIVPGSYKNNGQKGTASVTIRGCGEYGGTKTVKFSIGSRRLWFWWL